MSGISVAKERYNVRETASQIEHMHLLADMQSLCAEISKHIARGIVVLWQLHAVTWGRFADGRITLAGNADVNPIYIREVRVFDENAELHLLRRGDEFTGRWRIDGTGEEMQYIDSFSPLWGTREGGVADGYAVLADRERGLRMEVPVEAESGQYGLLVRGYIIPDANTGQAGYGDHRFVKIASV
jgi:CRISPR-associated protein, TIGR03984 family